MEDPISAPNTELAWDGGDSFAMGAREIECFEPRLSLRRGARRGAVETAKPAAATPARPRRPSAFTVEGETALLPGVPPRPATLLVGVLPPALGIVSRYWLIAEFPGGAELLD